MGTWIASRELGGGGFEGSQFGHLFQLQSAQGPVKHSHATDPTGEADATAAVNDAADGEGAAALSVPWGIKVVRKPPGVQTQRHEITRDLLTVAKGYLDLCEAMFAQFDAFVSGLAQHLHSQQFIFWRVVVLVLREVLVLALLFAGSFA